MYEPISRIMRVNNNSKLTKAIKLSRKLKKAIKSIHIRNCDPVINEINDSEKGIFLIKMDCKIRIEYEGKRTKSKAKAMFLVHKELIKSRSIHYRNMINRFNQNVF